MNRRSRYPSWDDFSKDDEYVYCEEDYKVFQDIVDGLQKRTAKKINLLLAKYGFGHLKVDYFDIEDTEMDEDGYDIYGFIAFDGKGISVSKLQHIDFTLTGDVSVETEEYEYMGNVQSWMESPPYEVGYIEVICPDAKVDSFELRTASSKFSDNNFLKSVEAYLIKLQKSLSRKRASSVDSVRKKRSRMIAKRRNRSSGWCNCRKK